MAVDHPRHQRPTGPVNRGGAFWGCHRAFGNVGNLVALSTLMPARNALPVPSNRDALVDTVGAPATCARAMRGRPRTPAATDAEAPTINLRRDTFATATLVSEHWLAEVVLVAMIPPVIVLLRCAVQIFTGRYPFV
jgi:hypothetical protein